MAAYGPALLTGTFTKVFSHKFSAFKFNEDQVTPRAGVDVFTEPGFHAANALEHMNVNAFPTAAYFPMDENASGYSAGADPYSLKDLAPAISTSVAFDEDGAWVGTAATNLWPMKGGHAFEEIPDDPAGTTYLQDAWETTDGWTSAGILLASEGVLRFTKTAPSQGATRGISIAAGKTVKLRARYVPGSGLPSSYYLNIVNTVLSPSTILLPTSGDWVCYDSVAISSGTSLYIYLGNFSGAETYSIEIDWIYIGDGKYLDGLPASNWGWQGVSLVGSKISPISQTKQELVKDGTVTRVHNTLDAANSLAITSGQYYTVSAYYRAVGGGHAFEEIPDDPAGTTYLGKDFVDADGWTSTRCTLSFVEGKMRVTATDVNPAVSRAIVVAGKTVRVKVRRISSASTYSKIWQNASVAYVYSKTYDSANEHIQDVFFPSDSGSNLIIYPGGNTGVAVAGDIFEIDFIYIGTGKYLEDTATEIDAATPTAFTLVKSTGGTAIAKANEKLSIPAIREKWQRGIGTAQFNEATTAWPYINWTALKPMTIRVCGMMLEQKPFASAWCYDTRAAGALAFNLHTSCGLNWNEDYTIMYWKKAHGTHDGSASYGYSVDSIGRNANTVGGGFLRWGKFKDGSMAYGFIGTSPAASIADYDDYQYHWYLHVLRRSGTTLTLRVYSVQGLFSSQSIDDSTAVTSDRYVTQNGYDLQLGGWDGANPCNTYYRDLVVLPGQGLTDEQLDRMYATKLRIHSNGTVLFNNLEEGII